MSEGLSQNILAEQCPQPAEPSEVSYESSLLKAQYHLTLKQRSTRTSVTEEKPQENTPKRQKISRKTKDRTTETLKPDS